MYGMVNRGLVSMIRDSQGQDVLDSVLKEAGVDDQMFLAHESYPDEMTYRIAQVAAKETKQDLSALLQQFGQYWILRTAPEHYGAMLDAAGSGMHEFLSYLPTIHTRLTMMTPSLITPEFRWEKRTEESGVLYYRTARPGLQTFVIGILQGLGMRFKLCVNVTLRSKAASQGLDWDEFEVVYSPLEEG